MSFQWTTMVMLGITLAAAIYVAWPLLLGRTRAESFFGEEPSEPVLQRLLFQRDTVYAAMKELEFDLAMGNLSQEDYQQLQDRYKRKAVAILKRIDDAKAGKLRNREVPEAQDAFLADIPYHGRTSANQGSKEMELDVEQEIQSFRRKSREQNERVSVDQEADTGSPAACPSCGNQTNDSEAAFCSKCGAPIPKKR